jgi:hypothetical protein
MTVIPANQLEEILLEIHLIDAYYMMHYSQALTGKDSGSFYKQLFDENKVTKAQFDSSLVYYAKHEPKRYELIYEQVINDLSHMSQDISIIRSMMLDSVKNLYKGKNHITIKGWGFAEKIPFEAAITDTGLYEITVQIQPYYDDESKNLRITAYSTCKNCKTKSREQYFKSFNYKKSSKLKIYQVSERITNKSHNVIRGWILDQDDQKNRFYRHVVVPWIFIKKIPNPFIFPAAHPLPPPVPPGKIKHR